MQTDAQALAKQSAEAGKAERLSWGVVELQVTDLERAVLFWTMTLGLQDRQQSAPGVALGTATETLVVLHSGATQPVSPRHTGMYHVAVGMPDQHEFSRILARLVSFNVPISPVDHLASKSIYLRDPDGLEIEIILETPQRFSHFGDMTQGLVMYDLAGQAHSGRERLDVEAELSLAESADLEAPMSNGAFLAHVHFKVGDLETAAAWFEGIGFARNLMIEDWGFADLGAGAAHTHRLAMNTWAGKNLPPAPDDMARLIRYELRVHDPDVMASATGLQSSETGLTGRDPTKTELSLIPAYPTPEGVS